MPKVLSGHTAVYARWEIYELISAAHIYLLGRLLAER